MGIFKDQAIRLLRETWKDPQTLAEEIFAIFNSEVPIKIDSPVEITINQGDGGVPLTLRNFGTSEPSMVTEGAGYPPPTFPPIPGYGVPNLGDFYVVNYYRNGEQEAFRDRAQDDPVPPKKDKPKKPEPGGGGVPIQVVSGSGQSYIVGAYPDGPSGQVVPAEATHLSTLPAGVSIPPGTWAIATKIGEAYYFQVPVWLEAL